MVKGMKDVRPIHSEGDGYIMIEGYGLACSSEGYGNFMSSTETI